MKATQNRRGSLHSLRSDDIRDSRISFGDTGSGSVWIALTRATQRVIHLADTVRRKRARATVKKTTPLARNNDQVGAVAGSNAGGFDAGERDEFAFVQDDALRSAERLPPFP